MNGHHGHHIPTTSTPGQQSMGSTDDSETLETHLLRSWSFFITFFFCLLNIYLLWDYAYRNHDERQILIPDRVKTTAITTILDTSSPLPFITTHHHHSWRVIPTSIHRHTSPHRHVNTGRRPWPHRHVNTGRCPWPLLLGLRNGNHDDSKQPPLTHWHRNLGLEMHASRAMGIFYLFFILFYSMIIAIYTTCTGTSRTTNGQKIGGREYIDIGCWGFFRFLIYSMHINLIRNVARRVN